MTWQQFVQRYGSFVRCHILAAVLGQTELEIQACRHAVACARSAGKAKGFAELFSLWHGRAPQDDEWPVPQRIRNSGSYEWLAPELALLASLVGTLGVKEIAGVLTARLRALTRDPRAERTATSVQVRTNVIGMQASDVLGGVTTRQAAKEIGSLALVQHAIAQKHVIANRVGRLWVIPYASWNAWKARRIPAPEGFVTLRSLREPLACMSDKLSEYATAGYIPTAVRCCPLETRGKSTQFGTWFVDAGVARQLVEDRRAGRPMPWHGKPMKDNLKVTYRLWQERKHPAGCDTCVGIWGEQGVPASFEDYQRRYPPIAHGAKRHLTMRWSPGLSIKDAATHCGRSVAHVRVAIANGVLRARREADGAMFVTRTDATRWKARKCPNGTGEHVWIAAHVAMHAYGFTADALAHMIKQKTLQAKVGTEGAQRDIVFVLRQQCAQLREATGYTESEAAVRVGVSVERLRELLDGVNWRGAERIPLVTIQAVIKRVQSRAGYSVAQAAAKVDQSVQWVNDRIADGTVRVLRNQWTSDRVYLSEPMMKRLVQAAASPREKESWSTDWLLMTDSAMLAGVSPTTLLKWAEEGSVDRQPSLMGWRYHAPSVREQARRYWKTVRFKRATPPAWLKPTHPSQTRLDGQGQNADAMAG